MADIIDAANDRAEAELARAIALARQAPPAVTTEVCLNCGEKVSGGRRWCDPECRQDWQSRRARR